MTKQEVIRLIDGKIEASRATMNIQLEQLALLPGAIIRRDPDGLPPDAELDMIKLISIQWKEIAALREIRELTIGAYPDPPVKPVDKAELLQ